MQKASALTLFVEWDVVEFLHPDDSEDVLSSTDPCKLTLGRINTINDNGKTGTVEVEELFQSTDGENMWLSNGKCHEIPQSSIMRVVDTTYSQRVDADRVSNPHGEHAEEVWEVSGLTLRCP